MDKQLRPFQVGLSYLFIASMTFAKAEKAMTSSQSIKLKNGTEVSIPTTTLFQPESSLQVVSMQHRELDSSEVLLFVGAGSASTTSGEPPSQSYNVVARLNTKTGKYLWRAQLNSYEVMLAPVLYKKIVICAVQNLIYGLNLETGELSWGFWTNSGLTESFAIKSVTEDSGVLTVSGTSWETPVTIELEAATGQRVYKKTKYTPPQAQPLYTEEIRKKIMQEEGRARIGAQSRMPHIGKKKPVDPEEYAPAEVPKDWAAYFVGATTRLIWSLKTGEGIIINPTKSDAEGILQFAKKQTLTLGGKPTPVKWLYVFDSKKIYAASLRPTRTKALGALAEKYPQPKKLVYPRSWDAVDYELGGEGLDAEGVAKALKAQVVVKMDEAIMTEAGPLIPKNEKLHSLFSEAENQGSFLALEWGPYQFGMTHIRLIPHVATY